MSDTRQFAVPTSPYALSQAELDRLRTQLGEAEAAASKEKDWTQKTRLEQSAKALRRQLNSAELERKVEHTREGSPAAATQRKKVEPTSFESRMAQGTLVRSDCGGAYLLTNVPKSGKGTPAANTQAQFAEPVPYFE